MPVMDAIRKIELADSEAMADAVMEHLGPLALTHGHISPIDAFELGWKARDQTLASKEAELVRLRDAGAQLANCAFNLSQMAGQVLSERSAKTLKLAQKQWDAALTKPTQPTE